MAANTVEHEPPWTSDAVFLQHASSRGRQRPSTSRLEDFHVTAGKTRGNREGLNGCKRRVSDMDPFCSAGSYLSRHREDLKYQHFSQCTSFFFAAVTNMVRVCAALCVRFRATSVAFVCFRWSSQMSHLMRWDASQHGLQHSSCKAHIKIQNLCWRMIRKAVLMWDRFCRTRG